MDFATGKREWKYLMLMLQVPVDHLYLVSQLSHCTKAKAVNQQLSMQQTKSQNDSRSALHIFCIPVKFLARRSLALRRHSDNEVSRFLNTSVRCQTESCLLNIGHLVVTSDTSGLPDNKIYLAVHYGTENVQSRLTI